MSKTRLESLRTKAKLLQKAKSKAGTPILLKEAFALLAKMSGFSSWQDLKANLDANELLCPKGHSAYWKTWYSSYSEAQAQLEKKEGFLLPYQKDFFICDANYILFLGLDLSDEDLHKVGNNWVQPRDMKAYERLMKKIKPS